MGSEQTSAGDTLPPNCELIEVRVAELKQLFKAIDPSPFREKDLDADAEDFIVSWAKDAAPEATLGLLVYVDRPAGIPEEATILRDAIHEFFRYRGDGSRRQLRELLRRGRTSLIIGLTFLTVALLVGNFVGDLLRGGSFGEVVREGLLISGWVAMWRPLEIFLYDWWPIRREARLYDRLAIMPVRIAYTGDATSEAWRWDWPAVASRPRPEPATPSTPRTRPN